jgi:hypothetical protein
MSHSQLHDFAATPEKGLPMHVKATTAPENMESTPQVIKEKKMGFPDYTPPGEMAMRRKPRASSKMKRYAELMARGPGE